MAWRTFGDEFFDTVGPWPAGQASDIDDDTGDIIAGSVADGLIDQFLSSRLSIWLGLENRGHFGFTNYPGEAIGTNHKPIAFDQAHDLDLGGPPIDLATAKIEVQDMVVSMRGHIFLANGPDFGQGLRHGMIAGEEFGTVAPNAIASGVANVGHMGAAPPDQQKDNRGAHVGQLRLNGRCRDDFLVGLADRFANRLDHLSGAKVTDITLEKLTGNDLNGHLAGDLAAELPAHAIRHDIERDVGIELRDKITIFVMFTKIATD